MAHRLKATSNKYIGKVYEFISTIDSGKFEKTQVEAHYIIDSYIDHSQRNTRITFDSMMVDVLDKQYENNYY